MADAGTTNVLVTIPISHYCEKARWALDRAGVRYRERAHVQALHRIASRRAGGGITVPVFVCPDGVLADSAAILDWADRQATSQAKLYPEDAEQAAAVRALEAGFDERLGPDSRRWLYQELRERRDLALAYGQERIPRWERLALRIAFPAFIGIVARVLDVTPQTADSSEARVRGTFDEVAQRLSDGRPYLCGEQFSAADLTFAALAAPMLVPPEYGVRLPSPEEMPARAAKVVGEMRAHPAGAHALAMFAQHRHAA